MDNHRITSLLRFHSKKQAKGVIFYAIVPGNDVSKTPVLEIPRNANGTLPVKRCILVAFGKERLIAATS
jgi:hypothetical protein